MDGPAQFIALQECADGNDSIGTEWIEAATFAPTATLAEVWKWSRELRRPGGRLMLRPDATERPFEFGNPAVD